MPRRDDAGAPDERSDAREQAVMLLYESEQRDIRAAELLSERKLVAEESVGAMLSGIEGTRGEIDGLIAANAHGWPLERMPALDRAILRLAIWELTSRPDVPVAVVIDEAVELAKRFSTDDSGRFVNGVLATVARGVRPGE
ncbi:MAG: transcription antitermination factor NusB [Ilumatobacteraceae bacterium]